MVKNCLIKFVSVILIHTMILFLFSCATTYHSIDFSNLETNIKNENEISITSNPYILQNNPKFISKAYKNNLRVLGIQINNNSEKSWILNTEKIKIIEQSGKEITLLNPNFASKLAKLSENGYVFWGLLWMGINGIPIPIGALISMSQISKAKNSNKLMTNDFNENVIKQTILEPNTLVNGLLFLNVEYENYNCKLYLTLIDEDTSEEKVFEYSLKL